MKEYILSREQTIDQPLENVFNFFSDASNLEALTPPWLNFQIITPLPIDMKPGAIIEYRLRWRVFPIHWRTEIVDWSPPHRFIDQQRKGPYTLWHHTHTFQRQGSSTRMTDIVRYALPLGPLGTLAHQLKDKADLKRIFDYRAAQVERLLTRA